MRERGGGTGGLLHRPIDGDSSPTAELEILRGQLSRVLCDAADAEFIFDDHLVDLVEAERQVQARFASGTARDFDVVAIAEGQRSTTRDRCFADVELDDLGIDIAYLTIPRRPEDTDAWRVFTATEGRQISLRPDNLGTIRATLAYTARHEQSDALDHDQLHDTLRRRFAGAKWQADRVLAGLEDGDLYHESLAQVHAATWSRGRVVLLGDAAHCCTPLAGFGTSLALIGAFVLAGELTADTDLTAALGRYEQQLRPLIDDVQGLPPGVPGIAYPDSKLGADLLRLAARGAAGPIGRAVRSIMPERRHDFALPDYANL